MSKPAYRPQFHPTDRIHLNGQSCLFLGETDTGYLFSSDNGSFIEVPALELAELVTEPGRFAIEPEFFKKARRK